MDALSRILSIKHYDSGLFALPNCCACLLAGQCDEGGTLGFHWLTAGQTCALWSPIGGILGQGAGLDLNASPAAERSVKFLLVTTSFHPQSGAGWRLEVFSGTHLPLIKISASFFCCCMDEQRVVFECRHLSQFNLRHVWTRAEPDSS